MSFNADLEYQKKLTLRMKSFWEMFLVQNENTVVESMNLTVQLIWKASKMWAIPASICSF